eukprot:CAMPEP_0185752080 /NCGR_PEP_ID=MMETSP1174-20130828/10873_1 /TAXON_ID=35687 /ORGANISM="Dictyocha speculum, Strain CCMP1381" /LENGTH=95 /DNA_ID=CAMNT_0028429355 /DNA_START=131 /DNA_END=419 /DNA_ORIENTATION=+
MPHDQIRELDMKLQKMKDAHDLANSSSSVEATPTAPDVPPSDLSSPDVMMMMEEEEEEAAEEEQKSEERAAPSAAGALFSTEQSEEPLLTGCRWV